MRKVLILLIAFLLLCTRPVSAAEYVAPSAPQDVQELMPADTENFAEGLLKVIKSAISTLRPELVSAAGACLGLIAATMLTTLLDHLPGNSKKVTRFVCVLAVGTVLLSKTNVMIRLGSETVSQLSEYGKLLLPVMTGALVTQGGGSSATALYVGTMAFDTVLSSVIGKILIPMIYMFLALSIANSATAEDILKKLRDLLKWLMTWGLKTVLYIFTGYMSITGVISGTVDAAAMKATKLTISGMIPVVGGILSDASEAMILGAGVMKSAAGVYGLLALFAIWITPFLQIGVQYLLLKLTAAICSVFGIKEASDLIADFSAAMGLLLGMTGAVCILLFISVICFMKGMG